MGRGWLNLLILVTMSSQAISLKLDKIFDRAKYFTGINGTCVETKTDFWYHFKREGHSEDVLEDINFGPVINEPVCGWQRINNLKPRKARYLGGRDAGLGEYPWTVMVNSDYSNSTGLCTGVLVSQQHVVTAGHCVDEYTDTYKQPQGVEVLLGLYDRSTEHQPLLPMQKRIVTKIHVHPYFRLKPLRYDVAVLKLDRPVQYAPNIVPICLAEKNETILEGTQAVGTGWGIIDVTKEKNSNYLQALDVEVMGVKECQELRGDNDVGLQAYVLRKLRKINPIYRRCLRRELRKEFELTKRMLPIRKIKEDMLCTGPGACSGDSGGPLMTKRGGRWFLIGMVSFGPEDCKNYHVYHRVGHTSDWISFITRMTV